MKNKKSEHREPSKFGCMKKRYIVLIVLAVILIGFRAALPTLAKNHVNSNLDELDGYHGSVSDVRMRLWRGAFQISDLKIIEEASADTTIPMVSLPLLNFSIDWGALFRGAFVGEVYMEGLSLNLTRYKPEEAERMSDYRIAFFEDIQEMNPIEINRFEAVNAAISYRDPISEPEIDVSANNLRILAENLGNVRDPDMALPASFEVRGNVMGEGSVNFDGRMNFLKEIPDFEVNIKLENIDLKKFDDFAEARAGVPVKSGNLYFYSEFAAKDGDISGYVKPAIENLSVKDDDEKNLAERLYQTAAEGVMNLLEDGEKEQVATRAEISGTVDEAEASVWQVISNLLRNAFVEAYSRELEYIIEFGAGSTDKEQS